MDDRMPLSAYPKIENRSVIPFHETLNHPPNTAPPSHAGMGTKRRSPSRSRAWMAVSHTARVPKSEIVP